MTSLSLDHLMYKLSTVVNIWELSRFSKTFPEHKTLVRLMPGQNSLILYFLLVT